LGSARELPVTLRRSMEGAGLKARCGLCEGRGREGCWSGWISRA
jgi:hypothetical protein